MQTKQLEASLKIPGQKEAGERVEGETEESNATWCMGRNAASFREHFLRAL